MKWRCCWAMVLSCAWAVSPAFPLEVRREEGATQSVRLAGRVISTGMSKGKVFMVTGEPDWRVSFVVELRHRAIGPEIDGGPGGDESTSTRLSVGDGQTVVKRTYVEEWLFNEGSRRFMRLLRFEDQKLVSIENLGYGFGRSGSVAGDWNNLSTGETSFEVRTRFGDPTLTDRGEEERLIEGAGEFVRYRVSQVEWWYYNTGPNNLFRRLKFVDGRLESVDTEGYGFPENG